MKIRTAPSRAIPSSASCRNVSARRPARLFQATWAPRRRRRWSWSPSTMPSPSTTSTSTKSCSAPTVWTRTAAPSRAPSSCRIGTPTTRPCRNCPATDTRSLPTRWRKCIWLDTPVGEEPVYRHSSFFRFCAGTTTLRLTGRTPRPTTGPRRCTALDWWSRSSPTSRALRWTACALRCCASAVTTSSTWRPTSSSCTTRRSRHRWRTLRCGRTRWPTACRTPATATSKSARLVRRPSGRWSWTRWTVARTPKRTRRRSAAPWSTLAPTSSTPSSSTISSPTTSSATTSRTARPWVSSSTPPGSRTDPTSSTPYRSSSTRSWKRWTTSTSSPCRMSSSGSRTRPLWIWCRSSRPGRRGVSLCPRTTTAGAPPSTRACSGPRSCPTRRIWSCRPATDARPTTRGSTIRPELASSRLLHFCLLLRAAICTAAVSPHHSRTPPPPRSIGHPDFILTSSILPLNPRLLRLLRPSCFSLFPFFFFFFFSLSLFLAPPSMHSTWTDDSSNRCAIPPNTATDFFTRKKKKFIKEVVWCFLDFPPFVLPLSIGSMDSINKKRWIRSQR